MQPSVEFQNPNVALEPKSFAAKSKIDLNCSHDFFLGGGVNLSLIKLCIPYSTWRNKHICSPPDYFSRVEQLEIPLIAHRAGSPLTERGHRSGDHHPFSRSTQNKIARHSKEKKNCRSKFAVFV